MVWDANDGYLVMFGGSNGTQYFNDTWEFKGKWLPLHPTASPPARRSMGLTYDSNLGEVVMFGGHAGTSLTNGGAGYRIFNDTWTFSAGQWTQVVTRSAPPPDAEPDFAYDPSDGYEVLFGGYNNLRSGVENTLDATWAFANGTWTNLSGQLGVHPSWRDGGCFAYLPELGVLYLWGGDYLVAPLPQTWTFALGHWTLFNATGAPPVRGSNRASWDPAIGALLTYGSPEDPKTGAVVGSPQTWAFVPEA
jgi:hypothetical protein